MKKYNVIDQNLQQIARGETIFPIVDRVVELPDDLAADFLATQQIAKLEDAEIPVSAPAKKSKGKKAEATEAE